MRCSENFSNHKMLPRYYAKPFRIAIPVEVLFHRVAVTTT